HESTQASLVRRRAEFGVLRALGATRGQVQALVLAETVLLGLAGVVAGLPLGYRIAAANVGAVSATLTNLYLLEAIESLDLPLWPVGLAAVIGVGGALAGGLLPALDLGRRPPTALLAAFTLHAETRSLARPLFRAGWAVLVLAGLWYWLLGQTWQPAGFVLGIALLVAIPLLTPHVVEQAAGWVPGRGLATRLQTTSFAVASLAIAVSMLVGVTLMIGSFRRTVEVSVETTVRADVYVTTPSWTRAGPDASIEPGIVAALASHPGVAYVDRLRRFTGYAGERRIPGVGGGMALPGRERRFARLDGDPAEAVRQVRAEGAVLVSEPLARKAGLTAGDRLEIAGAAGPQAFRIAGVYYDYSTEAGAAVMDLGT